MAGRDEQAEGSPREPDGAEAWAQAETLRDAGYELAVCKGPTPGPWRPRADLRPGYFEDPDWWADDGERTICPLVVGGKCALVDGADVVVSRRT
jgi:hypothetical protein